MENWEAASRQDLKRVRLVTIGIVFLHLIATTLIMVMGFLPALPTVDTATLEVADIPPFSMTIVVAAFVALITVIWAAVSAYEVVTGSSELKAVPDWSWHNRHFLFAILHLFVLAICLVPSITLFLLRSIGSEFWVLLMGNSVDAGIKSTAIYHCVLLFLMLINSMASIIIPTFALGALHKAEQAGDGEQDDDVAQPVPNNVKFMVGFKLLVDMLFIVDIIVMMSQTRANSSLFACMFIVIFFLCVFSYRTYRLFFSVKMCDFENWLEFWRYLTCAHIFCVWCSWWLAVTAFLLLGIKQQEFIETLTETLGPTPERTTYIISTILMLFVVVGAYTYLLFLHTRCMNTQNDVYSMKLLEKMNSASNLPGPRPSKKGPANKAENNAQEMKEVTTVL